MNHYLLRNYVLKPLRRGKIAKPCLGVPHLLSHPFTLHSLSTPVAHFLPSGLTQQFQKFGGIYVSRIETKIGSAALDQDACATQAHARVAAFEVAQSGSPIFMGAMVSLPSHPPPPL
jgi:hypothetical protein